MRHAEKKLWISTLLLLAMVTACSPQPDSDIPPRGAVGELTQPGAALVVLEGATLIDGTRARSLEDSVIVLEGNRILRVGQVGDFDYPEHALVTDVSGRFIVPGFINTHAHMFETFPRPLLAFGVTSVRNPGSGAECAASASATRSVTSSIARARAEAPA